MTDWGAHHVDIAQWALEPEINGPISIELVDAQHPIPFENGMPTVTDSYNTATSFRVDCKLANGAELVIRDNAEDLGFENGVLFECEGGRYFVNRGKLTGKPVKQLSDSPKLNDLRYLFAERKGRDEPSCGTSTGAVANGLNRCPTPRVIFVHSTFAICRTSRCASAVG